MNCTQVEENILFYIDHELSPETLASFDFHISECLHCTHLYQNIEATLQANATEKIKEEDFYFYARLKQRMENSTHQKNIFSFLPKRILQPIAVCCLLLIGVFTGINIGNQYNTPNANLTAEETRTSQLNAYSEETFIAEINNENIETLFTSNQ